MLSIEARQILSLPVAQFVLGELPNAAIPEVAMSLLEVEVETDKIVWLACFDGAVSLDLTEDFLTMLDEIEHELPSVCEATRILAKVICEKILDGSMSAYQGAREIWWRLGNIDDGDKRLRVFVGLASEYEDTRVDSFRREYELDIIAEASKYVSEF